MARARTDTADISSDIIKEWQIVKQAASCQSNVEDALASVETFIAIALRVMAKTNPSKIRSIAVTVEIQSLIQKNANEK